MGNLFSGILLVVSDRLFIRLAPVLLLILILVLAFTLITVVVASNRFIVCCFVLLYVSFGGPVHLFICK